MAGGFSGLVLLRVGLRLGGLGFEMGVGFPGWVEVGGMKRVWLTMKQGANRRFWAMFPLTRVPVWYRFVEPQPSTAGGFSGLVFGLG